MDDRTLFGLFGIKPAIAEKLRASDPNTAQSTAEQLDAQGYTLIHETDMRYPIKLRSMADSAPPLLYLLGNTSLAL